MKLRDILSKILLTNPQKKFSKKRILSLKSTTTQGYLLRENDHLCAKTDIDIALKNIDKTIIRQGPKNQLLLQKADLLLRKRKFKQARLLLSALRQDKSDRKTSNQSKKLLDYSHYLQQQESINKYIELIDRIRAIAKKYGCNIDSSLRTDDPEFESNILQLIRKEARKARDAGLPILSLELINEPLKIGYKSPWLLLGKAQSLDIMGRQKEALKALKELKEVSKGEKINQSIERALEEAQQSNPRQRHLKFNILLAKHARTISKNQDIDSSFLPKIAKISEKSKIKSLIYKQSLNYFNEDPKTSLNLVNCILDFVPNDGAALQLKGEALAKLKKTDKAIQIWAKLIHSANNEVACTASDWISKIILQGAESTNTQQSPEIIITTYIKEYLKRQLIPSFNNRLEEALEQLEPANEVLHEPDLRHYSLKIKFNNLLIEDLKKQFLEKGLLSPSSSGQHAASIRKTGPKSG